MKTPAGVAMCLAANCQNGISSYELHRCLGVTQKNDKRTGVGHAGLKRTAVQGIVERTKPSKHSRVVLKKTLVAIIIGLFFFVSLETILAVQRPPYPIKAEAPDAGHWVIISTNEKAR
jgi:hypothetical protein